MKIYRKQVALDSLSYLRRILEVIFGEKEKQRWVSRQSGTNHIKGRGYGIKNEGSRECYIYAFTTFLPPNTGSQSSTF